PPTGAPAQLLKINVRLRLLPGSRWAERRSDIGETAMASGPAGTVLAHLRHIVGPRGEPGSSDAELLRRFVVEQDEAAFAALVRRHGPMVLGVCRRILVDAHAADDAFQA